jgi:hypothetical protein
MGCNATAELKYLLLIIPPSPLPALPASRLTHNEIVQGVTRCMTRRGAAFLNRGDVSSTAR